jgi:hypothetical protein
MEVYMKGAIRTVALGVLAVIPLVLLVPKARALHLDVYIDTSMLFATEGALAFDLIDWNPGDTSQVVVRDFSADAVFGEVEVFGSVDGNLSPGPLRLSDSTFFSSHTQWMTFGNELRFGLEFDGFVAWPWGDSFSLYLLDAVGMPYATEDPLGVDAFLRVEPGVSGIEWFVYESGFANIAVRQLVPFDPVPVRAPAPIWLLVSGVLALSGVDLRRRREFSRGTSVA